MKILSRYDDLDGRRALVTGASSGIGLGLAEALLGQGARVAVHYLTKPAPAEAIAAKHPNRAFALRADLGTEEGCAALIRASAEKLGGLDLIVHCAAIWNPGPIERIEARQLEEIFRVNVFSAFYLVREAIPLLGRNGRGNIVLIGSTAGQRGEPGHGHYAATKGALRSLAMSLAVELAPKIRVNMVSPGWVRTPMAEAELALLGPDIAGVLPNRRVAEVEDVVHAVLYLASEASGHLAGEELSVSGGALLVVPRGQIVAKDAQGG